MKRFRTLDRHLITLGVAVLVFAALGAIAGCAGAPVIQTVKVAVPIACQETVPQRPVMPTEQFETKPTLDQFVQASQAEKERREGYEQELRAALEACTAPIEP